MLPFSGSHLDIHVALHTGSHRNPMDRSIFNYLHIVPGEGLYGLLSQVSGVPTTLFVDSQGKQVGTAYVGANDLDGWKTIADELLEGLEA